MIIVGPKPSSVVDFNAEKFCAIVNFNDCPLNPLELSLSNKYFWCPIVEESNWGYIPFYFGWQVYQQFKNHGKPIYFHCFAGINRSPTLAWAILKAEFSGDVSKIKQNIIHNSRLPYFYERNIDRRYVPQDIDEFLLLCKTYPNCSLEELLIRLRAGQKDFLA